MALRHLFGIALVLTSTSLRAALLPTVVYGPATEIAPGLKLREASSADPLWQIRIVEADLSKPGLELVPAINPKVGQRETVDQFAQRLGAVAAINAGYFNTKTGDSLSHFESDNKIVSKNARGPRSAFGVSLDTPPLLLQVPVGTLGFPEPANPEWDNAIANAIGGGPSLVTGGKVAPRVAEEQIDARSGIGPEKRNPRSLLGWKKGGKVLFVTVDGRQPEWSVGMTMDEAAKLLVDLGCEGGMNYDGGGSTALYVDGKIVNKPSETRPVTTAWTIVPAVSVDDGADGYSATGTWFPAKGGYRGSSMVTMDPKASATWKSKLPRAGRYEVQARWSAGVANTTLAEYQVATGTEGASATVNQTQGGSTWTTIGTWDFKKPKASVTLRQKGSVASSISADAVRFVWKGTAAEHR